MITKASKVTFNKSGAGSSSGRITIPNDFLKLLGVSSEDRNIQITYSQEDNRIIIEKENRLKMKNIIEILRQREDSLNTKFEAEGIKEAVVARLLTCYKGFTSDYLTMYEIETDTKEYCVFVKEVYYEKASRVECIEDDIVEVIQEMNAESIQVKRKILFVALERSIIEDELKSSLISIDKAVELYKTVVPNISLNKFKEEFESAIFKFNDSQFMKLEYIINSIA